MRGIIARTQLGGKDLFHGVPDIKDAELVGTETKQSNDDYIIVLKFELISGDRFEIEIRQEK